jgi:hypothetical protein
MQRLEVSGAVRPLKLPLRVKWLKSSEMLLSSVSKRQRVNISEGLSLHQNYCNNLKSRSKASFRIDHNNYFLKRQRSSACDLLVTTFIIYVIAEDFPTSLLHSTG